MPADPLYTCVVGNDRQREVLPARFALTQRAFAASEILFLAAAESRRLGRRRIALPVRLLLAVVPLKAEIAASILSRSSLSALIILVVSMGMDYNEGRSQVYYEERFKGSESNPKARR